MSIEEPLDIPIRVNQIRDPPLFDNRRFPDRHLELNLGSVERAQELHDALGAVIDEHARNSWIF
ncbi:hypothetical protein [Natrinema soli]|uniref:Uncharacterized protein n=1 Tax=Natrinema soli TaxID=1930624 RepID=A0ABD5SHM9_9EURY|nr:hypothetical protein [Natrinema soli]